MANKAAFILFERFLTTHLDDLANFTSRKNTVNRSAKKNSRSDFINICSVDANISEDEFNKKHAAFQKGSDYKNLYIDIFGHRFRYEKELDEN